MPTMYARCNYLLSLAVDENGQPCRYISKAETEDDVVNDMIRHMEKAHKVNGKELAANIRGATKPVRTKAYGTRPPVHH